MLKTKNLNLTTTTKIIHTNNVEEVASKIADELRLLNNTRSPGEDSHAQKNPLFMEFTPSRSANDKTAIMTDIKDFCMSRNHMFYTVDKKIMIIYYFNELQFHHQLIVNDIIRKTANICTFILVVTNINNTIPHIVCEYSVQKNLRCSVSDHLIQLFRKNNISYEKPNWERSVDVIIDIIFKLIKKKETIKNSLILTELYKIRKIMHDIFVTNIDGQVFIEYLFETYFRTIDSLNMRLQPEKIESILQHFSIFDLHIKNSTRYIIHIEALIIQCISIHSS